jgi:hypothetical protein
MIGYCILHDVVRVTVVSHVDFVSHEELWDVLQIVLAKLGVPLNINPNLVPC